MVRANAATALATAFKLKAWLFMLVSFLVSWRLARCDSLYVLVLYITTTPVQVQAPNPKIFARPLEVTGVQFADGSGYGAQAVVRIGNFAGPRRVVGLLGSPGPPGGPPRGPPAV